MPFRLPRKYQVGLCVSDVGRCVWSPWTVGSALAGALRSQGRHLFPSWPLPSSHPGVNTCWLHSCCDQWRAVVLNSLPAIAFNVSEAGLKTAAHLSLLVLLCPIHRYRKCPPIYMRVLLIQNTCFIRRMPALLTAQTPYTSWNAF